MKKIFLFLCILVCVIASTGAFTFFEEFTNYFTGGECGAFKNQLRLEELHQNLKTKLYGQHIVVEAVFERIREHVYNENPAKALALSFHGPTGTGKNYVSRIIAEALYPSGMKSKHVKLIPITSVFPHEDRIGFYKDKLQQLIHETAKNCERNIFIFDEMEHMPPGLVDIIKPYLDYYPSLDGIDYRKNIFIFLSNTGGTVIINYALEEFKKGRTRETITLLQLENFLQGIVFNAKGGLWHSNLIEYNLISAFIPFLPLEREHVKRCIKDELQRKHQSSDLLTVDEIADEMSYFPEDLKLYSSTGCKRVADKVTSYSVRANNEL